MWHFKHSSLTLSLETDMKSREEKQEIMRVWKTDDSYTSNRNVEQSKDYFIQSGEKTSEEFFQGIQNALRENTAVKGGDKTQKKPRNRWRWVWEAAVSRDQGVNLRPTLALLGMGHSSDWTDRLQMMARRHNVARGSASRTAGTTQGQESLVVHRRRWLGAQVGTGQQQTFRRGHGRSALASTCSRSLSLWQWPCGGGELWWACGLYLHVPSDQWCWAPLQVLTAHSYTCFGEMSIQDLCPFVNSVGLVVEFLELSRYSGC